MTQQKRVAIFSRYKEKRNRNSLLADRGMIYVRESIAETRVVRQENKRYKIEMVGNRNGEEGKGTRTETRTQKGFQKRSNRSYHGRRIEKEKSLLQKKNQQKEGIKIMK